jgi:hypothetical protein
MASRARKGRAGEKAPEKATEKASEKAPTTVTLYVTEGFQLPTWYSTATPDQQEEALRIGASLYETVKSAATTPAVTELEERKNQEIARIRAETEARMDALEKELAANQEQHSHRLAELLELQRIKEAQNRKETEEFIQAQYEGRIITAAQELEANRRSKAQMEQMLEAQKREAVEQTKRQADERIKAIQYELEVQQERIKALNAGKTMLEADRDRDIRVAEERTRLLLQQTLDEKERSILRGEKTIAGLQETIQQLSTETRALSDLLRKKTTNVKTKGNDYEELFRTKLIAAYSVDERFRMDITAKNGIGHAGDSITYHGDNVVLWEVKNYDKPVGTGEIDKFKRDMRENPQARIGVMVSGFTPLVGKVSRGNWDIEFIEGRMYIYLSEFESMSEDTLSFLMILFRHYWMADKGDEANETLETVIRTLERLHATAVKSKTEWRVHRSRMEDSIRWINEHLEDSETKLQNALNILQHNTTALDVPPGIFRECEGDEKMLQTIQCILDYTTPDEGGVCVLNDLADLVGKRKGLSRDTAKSHIRSVLLDSAFDQPKGKVGRVIGLVLKNTIVH